jgi:hypothetical protein
MKSSTYASIATIVFVTHPNAISKSIESVIRSTDSLCADLGVSNTLSHMTKYRIIADLLQEHILVAQKTRKTMKLRFSQKISDLL